MRRHADEVMEWLRELGYTHCFFVAGGNIMHLLDGARTRFTCVPTVHEVAATIAVEYFNEAEGSGRAFALVTAGPGLTNAITGMAGAYLESRECLVIGGQVKRSDLAGDGLRQRGIQEIDGVALVSSICVHAQRIETPVGREAFVAAVMRGRTVRRGPVFLEFCLDAQGAPLGDRDHDRGALPALPRPPEKAEVIDACHGAVTEIIARLQRATRPVLLLGAGVSREAARVALPRLRELGIPVQTTWNGIDRIDSREPIYCGRPNTWGQRFANVIVQQADLVIALGTRLGLQQTGFNWREFVPLGDVIQVDLDRAELEKGHPRVALALAADADAVLQALMRSDYPDVTPWRTFCAHVRAMLPTSEAANVTRSGYVNTYEFYQALSRIAREDDIVIPCSSGGANSTGLQAFDQKAGQIIITDKGLASMGYGLAGAIGAAHAHPRKRIFLVEGDGGFAQNVQELGTLASAGLNVNVFVFSNDGYASIRTVQKNYFNGSYIGCDRSTGLGMPDWPALFAAYGIPAIALEPGFQTQPRVLEAFERPGPYGFIVPVDPAQTYFPKISSRITASGGMESNPLHRMTPDLEPALEGDVLRYFSSVEALS